MKQSSVTLEQLTERLTAVLSTPELLAEYNTDGLLSDGVCGWCGVMSPLSRPAYVQAFGPISVSAAEQRAREEIKAREARHNATQYHAHTIEADNLQGVPAVGGFFWADNSGLRCDDGRGVFGEIATQLQLTDYADEYDRREHEKKPARLCQVREVYTVSPEDFNRPELADELTAKHQPEGGTASDDIDEGADWYDLTDEQRDTLYTFGALVTDGRRFFLIDSEGYDYPRYIYTPRNWRENLADIVAAERQSIEDEKAREAQQEAEEKAARLADYCARCKKWAHLMADVRPLEEKERKAWEIYTRSGYGKGTPEAKAHTTAKRATDNARKRNILAMCSAAFPGVKFSASVHRGWGSDFCLSWTDGPTAEEFEAATDLDLFRSSWETFCGYDDSTDVMHAEFTEFSAFTMGSNSGDVRAERNMSQEARADILAAIFEAVPAYDTKTARGYYDDVTVTAEQAHAVAERLGLAENDVYFWGPCVRDCYTMSADQLVHRAWLSTSYTATAPTEPTAPTEGGKAQDMEEDAPAEGLQLIETAEGVAVVGDSRTTYANRKAIKAHGATWNKAAQRWEAVAPEAVAALRRWFGVAPMECAELEAVEIREEAPSLCLYCYTLGESAAHRETSGDAEKLAEFLANCANGRALDLDVCEIYEATDKYIIYYCSRCGGSYNASFVTAGLYDFHPTADTMRQGTDGDTFREMVEKLEAFKAERTAEEMAAAMARDEKPKYTNSAGDVTLSVRKVYGGGLRDSACLCVSWYSLDGRLLECENGITLQAASKCAAFLDHQFPTAPEAAPAPMECAELEAVENAGGVYMVVLGTDEQAETVTQKVGRDFADIEQASHYLEESAKAMGSGVLEDCTIFDEVRTDCGLVAFSVAVRQDNGTRNYRRILLWVDPEGIGPDGVPLMTRAREDFRKSVQDLKASAA